MTSKSNINKGFTIVELLVVIVVIGILAAITIVSYSGVTSRAKSTQAKSNANSVAKVAEVCFAETNSYPKTIAAFASCTTTAKLPSNLTIISEQGGTSGAFSTPATNPWTALTDAQRQNSIGWTCAVTSGANCDNIVGGRITFWDFTASPAARSSEILYVGSATSSSLYVAPAAS